MSRFSGWHPSAPMVVAVIALVMAIAGTAIAGSATQGKITKEKVKTIVGNLAPSLDVNSAKTADRATTAELADTAKTAETAKIATNVLSANVRADGTMLGSIPAGATSQAVVFKGLYGVTFTRDITGCTISASLATNSNSQIPAGEVDVGVADAKTLLIQTSDSTGALASRAFYAQAVCPG